MRRSLRKALPRNCFQVVRSSACCMVSKVSMFSQPRELVHSNPWVIRANDFQSSDPRDKIFALLGFASAEERDCIQPDYTKPLHQIQLEVAAHLLTGS